MTSTRKAFSRQGFSSRVANMTPSEFAAACDIVIFVVPASPQIEEVLSGQGGLLSAPPRPGQILCDLTTSSPPETLKLGALAKAAGRDYLDCGMTGGATSADQGKSSRSSSAAMRRCSIAPARCSINSPSSSCISAPPAPVTR